MKPPTGGKARKARCVAAGEYQRQFFLNFLFAGEGSLFLITCPSYRNGVWQLASEHWAGPKVGAFSEQVVLDVYEIYLKAQGFNSKDVAFLETSRYLETYLWPNFSAEAPQQHLLSILLMVNEKVRQETHTWQVCTQLWTCDLPLPPAHPMAIVLGGTDL